MFMYTTSLPYLASIIRLTFTDTVIAKPSVVWLSTCEMYYLSQLMVHIADLDGRLLNNSLDDENRLCLRYNPTTSWTNYAQIRCLLATSTSASAPCTSMHRYGCNRALQNVIRLVKQLKQHEFLSFEALLGVSRSIPGNSGVTNIITRLLGHAPLRCFQA